MPYEFNSILLMHFFHMINLKCFNKKKGVPSVESSRSVQGLGKGVSGKPYPRLCNARRTRDLPVTGGKTLPLVKFFFFAR